MSTAGSVVVDTNVVVAYFRGEGALRLRFIEVAPLKLPWVGLGELHYGAERAQRRPQQLEFIEALLKYSVVVSSPRSGLRAGLETPGQVADLRSRTQGATNALDAWQIGWILAEADGRIRVASRRR